MAFRFENVKKKPKKKPVKMETNKRFNNKNNNLEWTRIQSRAPRKK